MKCVQDSTGRIARNNILTNLSTLMYLGKGWTWVSECSLLKILLRRSPKYLCGNTEVGNNFPVSYLHHEKKKASSMFSLNLLSEVMYKYVRPHFSEITIAKTNFVHISTFYFIFLNLNFHTISQFWILNTISLTVISGNSICYLR